MRQAGRWQRMTVYVAERHRGDQPLAVTRLLRRAAAQGMAGSTVFAGCAGFGRHHRHQAGYLHGLDETPLVFVVVDRPERLRAFRPVVDELLPDALVVVDDVDVIRHVRRPVPAPEG